MTELVLDRVLDAVLIGARRNATNFGHVYQPRRVTAKQARLLQVLVEHDKVGFDQLCARFETEWQTICTDHSDRYALLNKRALFQNLADIAARVNVCSRATPTRSCGGPWSSFSEGP